MEAPTIVKAYSYIRFSTAEQEHGHSEERQIQKAKKWVDQYNLKQDDQKLILDNDPFIDKVYMEFDVSGITDPSFTDRGRVISLVNYIDHTEP